LESYSLVLDELLPHINKDTLIVDVCSVKTTSEAIFEEKLHGHPEELCLHPLFGPQSAAQSTTGLPLVITRERGEKAKVFLDFCEHYLRITPVRMTASEHDKQMALVHALTFFTARGLLRMNLHETGLITPSFQRILDLVELEAHHSDELFRTIQTGNPYAADMRNEFINTLQKLNKEL
jgi:prephenate dehydrogenase